MVNFWLPSRHDFIFAFFLCQDTNVEKNLPLYFIQFSLIIPIPYGSSQYFWKFSVKKKNFCNKIFCMYNAAMINFRLSAHHDFIFALIFWQYTNFQTNFATQPHTIFFEYSNTIQSWSKFSNFFLSKRNIPATKISAFIMQWPIFSCLHATMLNILSEKCGHGQYSVRMMQWWSVFS